MTIPHDTMPTKPWRRSSYCDTGGQCVEGTGWTSPRPQAGEDFRSRGYRVLAGTLLQQRVRQSREIAL